MNENLFHWTVRCGATALLLWLPGCGSNPPPALTPAVETVTDEPRPVHLRGYELGVRKTVSVGQALLQVRDYLLTEKTTSKTTLRASGDFRVVFEKWGLVNFEPVTGGAGAHYPVLGTVTDQGRLWRVVEMTGGLRKTDLFAAPTRDVFRFYVGEDGALVPDRLHNSSSVEGLPLTDWLPTYGDIHFRVLPPQTRFLALQAKSTEVSGDGAYANYEILYSGVTGDAIALLYREYARDDPQRPARQQELRYDRREGRIRFRNFAFEIHAASNELITYTVVEDKVAIFHNVKDGAAGRLRKTVPP